MQRTKPTTVAIPPRSVIQRIEWRRANAERSDERHVGCSARYASATALKDAPVATVFATIPRMVVAPSALRARATSCELAVVVPLSLVAADAWISAETISTGATTTRTTRKSVQAFRR